MNAFPLKKRFSSLSIGGVGDNWFFCSESLANIKIKRSIFLHKHKFSTLAFNAPSNVSWTEIEQFVTSGLMKSWDALKWWLMKSWEH